MTADPTVFIVSLFVEAQTPGYQDKNPSGRAQQFRHTNVLSQGRVNGQGIS
jgi:hypothetical protein